MDAYCPEVRKLENKFYGLEFHHVVRDNNVTADVLSKLGSTRAEVPVGVFVHELHAPSEGPIMRPERGGSEWEPIKILLLRQNSAYTPNSQIRIPTRVCQGHVVTTDLPTLGTNPKQSQSRSTTQEAKDLAV
jgi:hypothetical protein